MLIENRGKSGRRVKGYKFSSKRSKVTNFLLLLLYPTHDSQEKKKKNHLFN